MNHEKSNRAVFKHAKQIFSLTAETRHGKYELIASGSLCELLTCEKITTGARSHSSTEGIFDREHTIWSFFLYDMLDDPVECFAGQLARPHFNKNDFSGIYRQHSIGGLCSGISNSDSAKTFHLFTLRRMGLKVSNAIKREKCELSSSVDVYEQLSPGKNTSEAVITYIGHM